MEKSLENEMEARLITVGIRIQGLGRVTKYQVEPQGTSR